MWDIRYQELFWLFMLGNVSGVVVEGVWCLLKYGRWETHTVSMWGPFNIVYGIGLPVFYVCSALLSGWHPAARFLLLALAGSLVEYLCGIVIRLGIDMRAWDYREHTLNIQGLISPFMAMVWGIMGLGFDLLLYAPLKRMLAYIDGSGWSMVCIGLTIFMMINFSFTAVCIIRWANRHRGRPAANRFSRWLDRHYPDRKMRRRFYYWYFLDEPEHITGSGRRRYRESFTADNA
ncbi:MAG: putative ABC transporter permease [Lachnospiraceae bacterium]|nr:putative ABC transporter permease [Lachnospiraceae bacterium]